MNKSLCFESVFSFLSRKRLQVYTLSLWILVGSVSFLELLLLSEVAHVIGDLPELTTQIGVFGILLVFSFQLELERDQVLYWKKHEEFAKAIDLWGRGRNNV